MNMNGQNSMIDTRLLRPGFVNETQHRRALQMANISDDICICRARTKWSFVLHEAPLGEKWRYYYVKTQINPIL